LDIYKRRFKWLEGEDYMIYIYATTLVLLMVLLVYVIFTSKGEEDNNLLEDFPNIYINKEELEKHAFEISTYYSHTKNTNCRRKLIRNLDSSYKKIIKGYDYIDKDVKNRREIVPAAEWLLDNLYLIEKEYKAIKHDMPESYYKNLPVISKGIMKGYPRVYHIAVEIVSHTDGIVDENTIEIFVKAYQKNTVLNSGELWALPIMLRIALIQNISKIVSLIIYAQEEKRRGDLLADRLIDAHNEERLAEEIQQLSREKIFFSSHFVERLIKVLRDNGVDNTEVYEWIDEKLEIIQTSVEKLIIKEHHQEANFQLSIGNCINSIRSIEALNWRDAFEKLSYVEQILKTDPSGVYEKMDFESRDHYRHRLERLARYMRVAESYVARKAVECAEECDYGSEDTYKRHIGYYLIDDGINTLKSKLNFRDRTHAKVADIIKGRAVAYYTGTIILGIVLIGALILRLSAMNYPLVVGWRYFVAAVALIIPVSEIVVSITNWSINHLINPRFVPKLAFDEGIPVESSTVVVIPTLINSEDRVQELVNDMEIYYLANHEDNLYFALLGDFKDSDKEVEEKDKAIADAALKAVEALNKKYCKNRGEIFYFLCRYRKYNEKQKTWMGWERKRGKLMEFNSLLRGSKNTSYNIISSDISRLHGVKYVITLDADTEIPRDGARRLVGAMSHVLNRPHYNGGRKRVVRGYGLMQPRVTVGNASANKTFFSKIFSGETGIDIYTTAVSDAYQDAFGEGIFTGKGIYDIDVFETVLKDVIPENTVLSHDLLEGSYARTALVTDIELVDGYPAYYNSSAMRLHRWVRGDWQLIPWLKSGSNLNALSKWKIVDNLRRSLLTPSIIILIILGLTVLPGTGPWLAVAFLSILCPILFDVTEAVVLPVKGISLTGRIDNIKVVIQQVFLIFCFIPYQGYMMLDAIVRTLYRVFISKRNLLEWQTSADVEARSSKTMEGYVRAMWMGSAIALIIGILSFNVSTAFGIGMLPSVIIWFTSPYIAYSISKDIKAITYSEFSNEDRDFIKRIGRKTWAYFEDFVNNENNWLAPDNYQEDPHNGVAYRTSPTNIGMGLTSNICAHDMGYIGIVDVVERTEKIVDSVETMSKLKGHLYNWYDTKTKQPLYPRYVSTVDSGNLVGYYWVTAEALKEYKAEPIVKQRYVEGLKDTAMLAQEELEEVLNMKNVYTDILDEESYEKLSIVQWKKLLMKMWSKCMEIEKLKGAQSLYWNIKLKSSVSKYIGELQRLAPWADMLLKEQREKDLIYDSLKKLGSEVSLKDLESVIISVTNSVKGQYSNGENASEIDEILELLENSKVEIRRELSKIDLLLERLNKMVDDTDFKLVFDKKRQLFSIGYDVEKESINNSYYDLLASEARAASFIAVAKGDVEQKHWFRLSRAMTIMGRSKGLVSWSGTMFEYFMPLLIMKNYPETLLNETYNAVIEGQKKYCRDHKVPWGISESAYYTFDVNKNYQYKAFGVPGIGLKRGLANELVIAPYASVMTLQIDPAGAVSNMRRLSNEKFEGRYGYYEAVDYTKERLPKGKKRAVIKCYMVHHEGMSLMALNNILRNNILQDRFHRIPQVKATELLLQEKVPKRIIYDREQQFNVMDATNEKFSVIVRSYNTAKTETPETHILSNGSYSLMISNSGSGYSKKDAMTVYRWREDVTTDNSGMFFYIKDITSDEYWSATYEPCKLEGDEYQVTFSLDKAEFKRKDGDLITHTEIAVSNEDNAEVRRLSITNHGISTKIVEVTSYCEVTLAGYSSDAVHPTFSNLFIKTEYVDNPSCIIANRRPRAKGQKKPYVFQTVTVEGETVGTIQYETSRVNFIGRGRDTVNPLVMEHDAPLLNTAGAVLDPIISIRRRVKIKAGETCRIAFSTGLGESKEEVIELARKYKEIQNINRVFELAWTQSQVEMKYLGIKSAQANLYQLMASKILFLSPLLRDREDYIKTISKHQRDLWSYGISGDLPIVLIIVRSEKDIGMVRQLLSAHEYWSLKGLTVDLVIINLESSSYSQPAQDAIRDTISSSHARDKQNKAGGVFLHNKSTMDEEVVDFLIAISRLVIDGDKCSLINQIKGTTKDEEDINFIKVVNPDSKALDKEAISFIRNRSIESSRKVQEEKVPETTEDKGQSMAKSKWNKKVAYSVEFSKELAEYYRPDSVKYIRHSKGYDRNTLKYFNGLGGFNDAGNYVIILDEFRNTPAPWINVISNESFGFHVSESGSAYTWSKNSRENKITPWSNDPISDIPGEALYIRDEESGEIWSITPKPIRDAGEYVIEHGFGYSSFTHEAYGIEGSETMFAPIKESVKICVVKLKNNTKIKRKLSLTYYAQLVHGVVPHATGQYINTNINKDIGYMYGQNPYSEHFGELKSFLSIRGGKEDSYTGNRKEFIGRGGSIVYPQAMLMERLTNTGGAGFDPCLAENSKFEIGPGEEATFTILLGQHENLSYIEETVKKFSDISAVYQSLEDTKVYWKELLGRIQVSTPDKTMDLIMNGWLMYQTISCRYWSRTAFYQSGGAYGYRDQLQDTMSIGFLEPQFTKAQILRSSERQFVEGDVQHWWHPVVDSGIRTRFSDDLLWLPYVTIDYIKNHGDYSILDEVVGYLEDDPLAEGEDERYTVARKSQVTGTVYEHCVKAIERGLKFGPHNIPLMGSGDWNDGMSTVGNLGRGESVWLGWFLYDILDDFKELCNYKGDNEKYKRFEGMANYIKENMELNAWDGGWYRRAYFDDGTPLGSIENDECQIDSLAQSWSVISGAAQKERAEEAMDALEKHLVKEDKGMILLLTPPFNKSVLEPGYIKGYVPGVRENGAQYTHAATWVILAMAKLGHGDKAWRLFNMINPINHSNTALESERYKVEPYVMAADVYIKEPHSGRGGWSWYTGASGWMFRVGIEAILGLKLQYGKGFTIEPNIPRSWSNYSIKYKKDNCQYNINIKRGSKKGVILDGKVLEDSLIPYLKDGIHNVEVTI
jgi:cyclic beta-1,2-glucan synthetase